MSELTYGEAAIIKQSSSRCENGEVVFDDIKLPKRMNNEDAIIYYNDKLYGHWLSELDKRIPVNKREKVLNTMLGRTA